MTPPRPMKATGADALPVGPGWSYEVKWDGFRVLCEVRGDDVSLWSSNGLDSTARFASVAAGAPRLRSATFDGEVLAFDDRGRPSFGRLQRGEGPIAYVVFDLLELDGRDLTGRPLAERRDLLAGVELGPGWRRSPVQEDGEALLAAVRAQGLEGVMAKRDESAYVAGRRSRAWLKVKVRRQQEVVVGGWLPGQGSRSSTFASLLVGVHEPGGGPLRFAGGVGTGFDTRTLHDLQDLLAVRATTTCPFDPVPPPPVRRQARWVVPDLVVEVAFGEWTDDGILRHASYLGLRDDKDPAGVVREPGM